MADEKDNPILNPLRRSPEESASQVVNALWDFVTKNRRQRINQRNRAELLSDVLDWRRLGVEYQKARWVAIDGVDDAPNPKLERVAEPVITT
ncbi:glycosyltransferase family 3 protein [Gonapodya prolifera JEL478]|uniref:Glycogen [starch] synthase n=1 Tax=Gonapodya prolifera (strain JEL478) TaxID=1344416 RepID=A0A139AV85_GONPJ|nr:glycosyltransferase family 3 protein [Gonapodya prolifera JEL478]|eukprot:KXS20642.1 glycosyltransferase family 3 protein [Gonapodya prolifera JEL478]